MTSKGSGPGKTAPKLAEDFLVFDPRRANPNVLLDLPPPQGEGPQIAPHLASCKHLYTVKQIQSVPPPLDLRSDGSTTYKLSVRTPSNEMHGNTPIRVQIALSCTQVVELPFDWSLRPDSSSHAGDVMLTLLSGYLQALPNPRGHMHRLLTLTQPMPNQRPPSASLPVSRPHALRWSSYKVRLEVFRR